MRESAPCGPSDGSPWIAWIVVYCPCIARLSAGKCAIEKNPRISPQAHRPALASGFLAMDRPR
ncbi:hypothetical protein GLA29479_1480 [Lysobacter antibioticus]|uniref:Uncharacterized protein n=1 Tax=Lysobacter antibioticus TaxID=84531 RepID=A0A0S2DV78_LYSAN|nr:hypothetical protein GLA29479_1480 [Lysobacter antibioticus]ALN80166.1 hypothetical protein LA76x_2023 [Lysobacter antibioticus]